MKRIPWIMLLLWLFVASVWLGSWKLIENKIPPHTDGTYTDRGQFGDMFGAVNSLFSGLAMAGVIYTVYLQQREIQSQREEQTRSESARSNQTALLNEQLNILKEQFRAQREKDLYDSAPRLTWTRVTGDAKTKSVYFKNLGGRFKILAVYADQSIIASWLPRYQIDPNSEGSIEFKGIENGKGKFHIWIDYESRMESGRLGYFIVRESSEEPIPDDVSSMQKLA